MDREKSLGALRSLVLIFAALTPALAQMTGPAGGPHDEYLQSTWLSVEKDLVRAQIELAPNADAFPMVMADIDTDGDGDLSPAEERAYAAQVLRDASVTLDGNRIQPRLVSMKFPSVAQMKEGTGRIHLQFQADLSQGGASHTLTFDNRHESRTGVYRVDVLPSTDPDIRFVAQNRNARQSFLELDYQQTGVHSHGLSEAAWPGIGSGTLACLLLGWITFTFLKPVASRLV